MSDTPPPAGAKDTTVQSEMSQLFTCELLSRKSAIVLTGPTINVTHIPCQVQIGCIPWKRALRVAEWRNTSISETLGRGEVTDVVACSFNQVMNKGRNLNTRTKMTQKIGRKDGQECHQVFYRSAGKVSPKLDVCKCN